MEKKTEDINRVLVGPEEDGGPSIEEEEDLPFYGIGFYGTADEEDSIHYCALCPNNCLSCWEEDCYECVYGAVRYPGTMLYDEFLTNSLGGLLTCLDGKLDGCSRHLFKDIDLHISHLKTTN